MESNSLTLKALSWVFKDSIQESVFLLSGISEDVDGVTRSTQVKVRGFRPFCYLELPGGIDSWLLKEHQSRRQVLLKHIELNAKRKISEENKYNYSKPLQPEYVNRFDLYGKIPKAYLYLEFVTLSDARAFVNFIQKEQIVRYFYGTHSHTFKAKEFKVHEHNIDPIIHLTYKRKLNLVGWLRIDDAIKRESIDDALFPGEDLPSRNPAFGSIYECHYQKIFPIESDRVLFPKYISFDFECDSENHNAKLPDPANPKNAVRNIGIVIGRFGDPVEKRVHKVLTLGKTFRCSEVEPLSKDGFMRKQDYRHLVTDVSFDDEREMFMEFGTIIKEENPDVMLGFNIMKFDWDYLISRCSLLGILAQFLNTVSRFQEYPAEIGEMKWQSSAYGEQKAQFVNIHGRVNVDVIMEIQRNYKFQSYSLDSVSEYFLKQKKEDVSPSQMFMIFRFFDYIHSSSKIRASSVHRKLDGLFPTLKTFGFLAEAKEELKQARTLQEMVVISERLLTMVAYYCVIDCILPVEISDKMNLWFNMEQLAGIMKVPTSYLHPRGQQIKVLSQLYPVAKDEGIVIPNSKNGNDSLEKRKKYMGAIVIEATPGVYVEVDLDDFMSLYPTEMISRNICHTTYLDPSNPEHAAIPDSECSVQEWMNCKGCEHDTIKRTTKIKPEDVLCGPVKYRFRKVEYIQNEDGTVTAKGEGVVPKLLRRLLGDRSIAKKKLAACKARIQKEKDTLSLEELSFLKIQVIVLDALQNSLKISSNSIYGGLGASTSYIPHPEGAACVTAGGREHLVFSKECANIKYGATTIYGDSVTGDTPILVQMKNGHPQYVEMQDLFLMGERMRIKQTILRGFRGKMLVRQRFHKNQNDD